jgi:CopG family nickel-responsive transcriptional regulator
LSDIIRFGVSIDEVLLKNYDRYITDRGYVTRSEALRDLIRDALIQNKIENKPNLNALGSLTLVYDHHAKKLLQEVADIQHNFHSLILSVMHIHVNHNDCMEILALNGVVSNIVDLSNKLLSLKGVKNGKLFLTLPSSDITNK